MPRHLGADYRWAAGCCADVMLSVSWSSRWLPAGLVSPGKTSMKLSGSVLSAMTFTLKDEIGAITPAVDSDVKPSSRLLFPHLTTST